VDQLPKNFKLVSVFAIVIGAMGIVSGVSSGATVIIGSKSVIDAATFEHADPDVRKIQEEVNAASIALSERWRIPSGLMALSNLVISSLLLAAGIMTNGLKRNGRRLLSKVLLVAIIFDAILLIPTLYLTSQTLEIQQHSSGEMAKAMSGANAEQAGAIASIIFKFSMYLSMAFLVGWVGIKIWYYVWARKRLAKPDIDALFAQYGQG
jgi:hypothetical protein